MATLFVYDGGIKEKDGAFYTDNFGDKLVERYSYFNENVEYIMREIPFEVGDEIKYSKITHEKFKFTSIPNICSIKGLTVNASKIKKTIKDRIYKSNIIIIRLPSFAGIKAIRECIKLRKPYIVELVTCPWDAFWNHSLKGKLVAPFMYFMNKKYVKNAKYVLYVSKEFLQRRYPCYGRTISCSDVILKPLPKNTLDKRLNKIKNMTYDKSIVLGTIAAVNVRYKGQKYVIKAISRLNKKGYNFEYHIVGGGDQSYLKAIAQKCMVSDKVKFLGPLKHDKVFDFIQNIDLYVQPSNAESHGRVIVEAMSLACPVIGSSTGGIPELVSPECVFERKNVKDLERVLKKIDKYSMENEAVRSFEKAKEFDVDLLDEKRTAFYKEFAQEYKATSEKVIIGESL